MGWFDKQIKQRNDHDQQLFEESLLRAAGIVHGKRTATQINDEHIVARQAIDDILKYYHFKPVEFPKNLKTHEDQLDYCLRPYGLMKRKIVLEDNWFRDASGPVLAYTKEEHEPIALLPDRFSGYCWLDRRTNQKVRLTKRNAEV